MMMQTETVGKFFYPRFQISLNCLNLRAKNQIVEFFIEFMEFMDKNGFFALQRKISWKSILKGCCHKL